MQRHDIHPISARVVSILYPEKAKDIHIQQQGGDHVLSLPVDLPEDPLQRHDLNTAM
jgi:hypothetical protein